MARRTPYTLISLAEMQRLLAEDYALHRRLRAFVDSQQDSANLEFATRTERTTVLFGCGALDYLGRVCDEASVSRVMIATTRGGWARHKDRLNTVGPKIVAIFDQAEPHCPEPIIRSAQRLYTESGADCVIAIGGGSSLGLGKVLSAEQRARFIAVPTTYSGSEMTPIFGRKVGHEKRTKRDPQCQPFAVLYDPLLTVGLPVDETVQTGMNSLAHSIEALYASNADELTLELGLLAVDAHWKALPKCVANPSDLNARSLALLGGFLGGFMIERHGIALHHQLCHVLGGLFDLPHGVSNSVVLPHALDYNARSIPDVISRLSLELGVSDPAKALFDFAGRIGAPQALSKFGIRAAQLEPCIQALMDKEFPNPRPLERPPLLAMAQRMLIGEAPQTE